MAHDHAASVSLLDMLDVYTDTLEISPGKVWPLHPLSLTDMAMLLHENTPVFFALYTMTTKMLDDPGSNNLDFGPIITSFPEIIAKIIALSTEQASVPGAVQTIQMKLPITLQLIALEKIWRISVPDPKKLKDLLFVVMGQWQKAMQKLGETNAALSSDSATTSAPPLSSSSAMDIESETLDATP